MIIPLDDEHGHRMQVMYDSEMNEFYTCPHFRCHWFRYCCCSSSQRPRAQGYLDPNRLTVALRAPAYSIAIERRFIAASMGQHRYAAQMTPAAERNNQFAQFAQVECGQATALKD